MKNNTQMIGIAIYRISTEGQEKKGNIGDFDGKSGGFDRQKTDVKNLRIQHNIKLVDEIKLIESGSQVQFTKEYQNLFTKLKNIDCIVVADVDRYVRGTDFTSFQLLQNLKDNDVKIVSPTGILDFNSDMGFLMGGLQSLIGGLELSKIKTRMLGGKNRIKDAGGHASGYQTLPYGLCYYKAPKNSEEKSYFYYDKKLIPNVLKIFDGIEHNLPYQKIADELGLSRNSVPVIASNMCWIGFRKYETKRVGKFIRTDRGQKYKKKQKLENPLIVKAAGLEKPLISEARYNKIIKLINDRKERENISRDYSKNFLYTQLAVCGDCGRPLYAKQKPKNGYIYKNKKTGKARFIQSKKDYYICSSGSVSYRIKKEKQGELVERCGAGWQEKVRLETIITEFITKRLTSWDFYNELKEIVYNVANETNYDVESINKENINRYNKRIKEIEQDYLNGDISAKEHKTFKNDLLEKINKLKENEIKSKIITTSKEDKNKNKLFEFCNLMILLKNLAITPIEERKHIIKMIFSYIKIEKYKITEFGLNTFNPKLIDELKYVYEKTIDNKDITLTPEKEKELKVLIKDPNKVLIEYIALALANQNDWSDKDIKQVISSGSDDNPGQAAALKLPIRFY